MRDTIHNQTYKVAIPPVVVTDNTPQVGAWIDRSGYDSLSFAILTGTLADTDATFAVYMEDADASNHSDAWAAAEQDSLSAVEGVAAATAASFTHANSNFTSKIGYIGGKQFVRITVTPAANSGNAPLSAVAILGNPSVRPV
jgi:hypothetical protein